MYLNTFICRCLQLECSLRTGEFFVNRLRYYSQSDLQAGFYFIRDDLDTGHEDNPLHLPAFPYELPILIQDRMFKDNGELFYPAFPGDPEYQGFITEEGAVLPEATFPGGGPTALAVCLPMQLVSD